MTSMKAIPGTNGEPPYLRFKDDKSGKEMWITCDANGQPKGIATPKKDSENVNFFAQSLQELIKVETKNGKAPVYAVKGSEKPLGKLQDMVNGEHEKYGKKGEFNSLKDAVNNATVKQKKVEKEKVEDA